MHLLVTLIAAAGPESLATSPEPAPSAADVAALAPSVEPATGFALAPTQADAGRKWTGSIGASASLSSGNTDKKTVGATANVEGKTEQDRWSGQLLWTYSDEKGQGVTERRTYGQIKYDYFLTAKSYLFGVASGENDFAKALDLRTTIGGGYGYQFRDDEEWKISGEAGVSYVDEDYEGSADDTDYVAARLAYKVDTTLSESWSVGQWGELFTSLEDSEDVSARVDTHAKVALSEKMFGQVQHIFSWDNTPATGAERDDQQLLLTFGWSF